MAGAAPVVIAPVSAFEAYWGYPPQADVPSWEAPRHPDSFSLSGAVPESPVRSAGCVHGTGTVPRKSRRWVWRPELTNKTHDQAQADLEAVAGRAVKKKSSHLLPRPRCAAESVRPVRNSTCFEKRTGRASDAVHVRAYCVPSWFDVIGVSKKRKLIEAKGLPNFQNWRFITLTMSRKRFDSPLAAYLAGVDHMRRFMASARKHGLWLVEAKWCWKFEFQKDGWPHWHLLVERKARFTHDELSVIRTIWGMGRTHTRRVNQKDMRYDFKYSFKSVTQEGFGDQDAKGVDSLAPAWFLDYLGSKSVKVKWTDSEGVEHSETSSKPVTFSRARFWQTSRGFYTGKPPEVAPEKKEQVSFQRPRLVREVLEQRESSVQVVARSTSGEYITAKVVPILGDIKTFWNLIAFDNEHGGACGLAFYQYMVAPHRLKTDKLTSWQLKPILETNRLTLRKAKFLRSTGNPFWSHRHRVAA